MILQDNIELIENMGSDVNYKKIYQNNHITYYSDSDVQYLRPMAFAFSPIKTITLQNCDLIKEKAFCDCHLLEFVALPNCTTINESAFQSCYNLSQIYLTGLSICNLTSANIFASTPFTGFSSYFSGTPSIFVRANLLDEYKNTYNFLSSYFVGV